MTETGIGMSTAADMTSDPHTKTLQALSSAMGEGTFATSVFRDNLRLLVSPGHLLELLRTLKDSCGFAFLSEVGAADYLKYPGEPRPDRFEVHYVLRNLETSEWLVVKTGVSDPDPVVPSAEPLWAGAGWMEREVFDMYGIRFEGHSDLRRILMPDEFTAFPLRKDYPLRGRGERHNFPRLLRADS